MELMRLLKNGKSGGSTRSTAITTIAATVLREDAAAGDGRNNGCDDEGPFFDLDFAAPMDEEEQRGKERYSIESDSESESDESASESGSVRRDHILSLSPSDDLFFKGRLLPLEPCARLSRSSSSASTSTPQVAAFLLKSAAKFRVFKLGLRKKSPKPTSAVASGSDSPAATAESPKIQRQHRSKLFVKFKLEDEPAASIFTRDSSSSRSSGSNRSARLFSHYGLSTSDDKKMTKDVLQRYLNKIKPLYVQVSKRYGEMLRFPGSLSSGEAGKVRPATEGGEAGGSDKDGTAPMSANRASKYQRRPQNGSIPSGLKVVGRRLRKSRSASAAVSALRSSPAPARRDDSLLAQQDGIQSAIAHCKRSFNRGSDTSERPLTRSISEPRDARTADAGVNDEV